MRFICSTICFATAIVAAPSSQIGTFPNANQVRREAPTAPPAGPDHEFPFWFNATWKQTLDNGSTIMISKLVNSSLDGISRATNIVVTDKDLMTRQVFPLNNGNGIAIKLFFSNTKLADNLYDWLQHNKVIPVDFQGKQLMALGMPRDGPTPAPQPDTNQSMPKWMVYPIAGAAVALLVMVIFAVGYKSWAQPKRARYTTDDLIPSSAGMSINNPTGILPSTMSADQSTVNLASAKFTPLHIAVFQGDIPAARTALATATTHSGAAGGIAPPFPELDDLDDLLLDPDLVTAGISDTGDTDQAASSPPNDLTYAATSPSVDGNMSPEGRGLTSPQAAWMAQQQLAQQQQQQAAFDSWRRFGLMDAPPSATLSASSSAVLSASMGLPSLYAQPAELMRARSPPAPFQPTYQAHSQQVQQMHAQPSSRASSGSVRPSVRAMLDARDRQGNTALAWSVRLNNFGMMQYLIGEGASLSLADNNGQSPLHIAAMCSTPELMCDYLLKNGAPPNALDTDDNTPLMYSCRIGCCDTVATLLRHGSDVLLADRRGMTALMHAASQGRARVIQLLLQDNHSTVNLQDASGWTALMWAVAVNSIDSVQVLLAVSSISLSVHNEMKETVFHLAARRGNPAIVELLLAFQTSTPVDRAQSHMEPIGDLLSAMSAKGLTPIDYALQASHRNIAQQLGHVLCGATVKQEETDDKDGDTSDQGVESLQEDSPLLPSTTSSSTESSSDLKDLDDKREKRRLYMRRRRAQQRQQIQEMEVKVDALNEENHALTEGLRQLQAEADSLRRLLSA
eukprot:TRINITY_DN11198_c0_g1_i1.p1 TRINITY_DN11198_c0_g1~~TRINITY_DN11198_c0_g1_i1.p1  ORF type:complete len:794 (+),score=202.59 TRINITY_DN11198_c0_g1_i1:110-2491(+)